MKILKTLFILFFALSLCLIPIKNSYSGGTNWLWFSQTDAGAVNVPRGPLAYFFDLRERETFIQLTYPSITSSGVFRNAPATAHIQIFDVSNNCNENNFFDNYTVNDTHVYNMRNIQTNDGNPSGVVLPDGAYGIVTIVVRSDFANPRQSPFGNMRIIDNNGYEYRTNAQTLNMFTQFLSIEKFDSPFYSFNFNKESGITFSDVIGITTLIFNDEDFIPSQMSYTVFNTIGPSATADNLRMEVHLTTWTVECPDMSVLDRTV